jgi:hypothetical protein
MAENISVFRSYITSAVIPALIRPYAMLTRRETNRAAMISSTTARICP